MAENLVVGPNNGMYSSAFIDLIPPIRSFHSRSCSLHHRIPMGSRQVSHETIVKKSFGNHFQSKFFSSHWLLSSSSNDLLGCNIYWKWTESPQSILQQRQTKFGSIRKETNVRRKSPFFSCSKKFFSFSGSLLTRNLNDVLKKEHFLLGSEYLKTLLVCVPKSMMNDWYAKYESLCSMIVPRTSELITQDQDYALFSVTLFQKTEDVFRVKCRENK